MIKLNAVLPMRQEHVDALTRKVEELEKKLELAEFRLKMVREFAEIWGEVTLLKIVDGK